MLDDNTLQSILDDWSDIEKDIRERVSAKSSRPLQAVAKMVLESVGSELSLRRIAGAVHLSALPVFWNAGDCSKEMRKTVI